MAVTKFQKLINNSFLFRLYLLKSLPLAFIAGIRVKELNNEKSTTVIKYKWLTQNPFKSMYFACHAMAAEMSTGLLVMNHTYMSKPSISMLVTNMNSVFMKRVTGAAFFTCEDGDKIQNAINTTKETGEGVTLELKSLGRDELGEVVSEFTITWSLKVKRQ